MKRTIVGLLTVMGAALWATPAYAQGAAGAAAAYPVNWVAITAGFSMAFVSAICGLAQARAVTAACEGVARNPGARPGIQFFLILGLVLIESLALYVFAIIFAVVAA